jgi:uncharacterized repeat protein (TIGR03803 family)
MRSLNISPRSAFAFLFLAVTVFAPVPRAFAQQESILHNFNPGSKDGVNPQANLIFDASGNLYSTTFNGGIFGSSNSAGTAFELSPAADGTWTETVLHNFGHGHDGTNPAAGLLFDTSGNLYGTTYEGGAHFSGTVFELSPALGGGWTEKILHHFNFNGKDGIYPYANLILDATGNLYGTTFGGGTFNAGTVFELIPASGGNWNEKILHSFASNGRDGVNPFAGLILDASGNLYSTTSAGGVFGYGTVFELSPASSGSWTEKILHNFNFNGQDGVQTYSGLAFDTHGNLYGTTPRGGAYGYGTVFELIPGDKGKWTEKILHNFNSNGEDGVEPAAAVSFDASGNLYSTTLTGGFYNDGTVFELTPSPDGSWAEKTILSFSGVDGVEPESSVVFDAQGNLYGTTNLGGPFGGGFGPAYGYGTVFRIRP